EAPLCSAAYFNAVNCSTGTPIERDILASLSASVSMPWTLAATRAPSPVMAAATPAAAFAAAELKEDRRDCASFIPCSNCAVSAPRMTRTAPTIAPLAILFQASVSRRNGAQDGSFLFRRLPFPPHVPDEQLFQRNHLSRSLQGRRVPGRPRPLVVLKLDSLSRRLEMQRHETRRETPEEIVVEPEKNPGFQEGSPGKAFRLPLPSGSIKGRSDGSGKLRLIASATSSSERTMPRRLMIAPASFTVISG